MREQEYIALFAGIHGTNPYSADAEIVETGNGYELFSTDSFSETEDFFTDTPPEIIGHDMAVAACSDLLACGIAPEILLQSWNIDESKGADYYRRIAAGIENVLRRYRAKCVGGDLGTANPWSYTATVYAHGKTAPVTRVAKTRRPFDLYISGRMGLANLALCRKLPMPEFALRDPVPQNALFATDTSGGFFDALENFRRVNAGMRLWFEILDAIAPEIFQTLPPGFDPILSLIGGVGEYELVFAVPRGAESTGIKIGEGDFSDTAENEFRWSSNRAPGGRMKSPPPDYRDIPPEDRVSATIQYLKEMREP